MKKVTGKEIEAAYVKWLNRRWKSVMYEGVAAMGETAFKAGYRAAIKSGRKK